MSKIRNIAVDLANFRTLFDYSNHPELEQCRDDPTEYIPLIGDMIIKGKNQLPILPGKIRQIIELLESYDLRPVYLFDRVDLSADVYWKAFKKRFKVNPKINKVFIDHDVQLGIGPFFQGYINFFDYLIETGEFSSDFISDRVGLFYQLQNYQLRNGYNFIEPMEHEIFNTGIMYHVEHMSTDIFRKLKKCKFCGKFFFGNKKALFCSASCRSHASKIARGLLKPPKRFGEKSD